MNTTLLFAEILIVGLQSGVWLIFLLLSLVGVDWIATSAPILKDWQTALLAVFIPLLYVIGILIDRLSDRLFENWNERIKKQLLKNAKTSLTVMRFALGKDNEVLNQQIEYTRTRMRIVRASSVNFILIAIFASIFVLSQAAIIAIDNKWVIVSWIALLGSIFSVGAALTWRSLLVGYIGLIRTSFENFALEYKKRNKNDTS